MKKKIQIHTTILFVLLALVVAACQADQGPELPFESIAQRDIINYWEESPALIVIASDEEVDELIPTVLAEDSALADQLHKLNYNRFFAILVLQGQKRQGGYGVAVQQIVREDLRVNVYAEFTTPEPDTRNFQAFTSPYNLVAVSKNGKWKQQVSFELVVDNQTVVETTHFIP